MADWVKTLTGETQARLLALLRKEPQSIASLADELDLTDNAVRTHVAGLARDGLVEDVGVQRDTGGKPARLYGITREGEELFPKAYAAVLGELIEEIMRRDGRDAGTELLRAVGRRVGSGVAAGGDGAKRVAAAAEAFRRLGGEIEVQRVGAGWKLQGSGCPLSAVSSRHDEICALAQALIATITGEPVTECCERGERPRCGFVVREGA